MVRSTRDAVTRLATVVAAGAPYVVAVLWPWHHRTPGGLLVDPPALLVAAGLVMVFFLPVMAYVAAAGSTRALATAPPRGRLVLDGVVIALALVAVATYVSPWGIAAARALPAD